MYSIKINLGQTMIMNMSFVVFLFLVAHVKVCQGYSFSSLL